MADAIEESLLQRYVLVRKLYRRLEQLSMGLTAELAWRVDCGHLLSSNEADCTAAAVSCPLWKHMLWSLL